MADNLAIKCVGLQKSYPDQWAGFHKKKALIHLNIQVHQQEVFGIVGPNGAGKSTLLKLLMGFIAPNKGIALINDQPAHRSSSRKHVGYLPENPCLYSHLSIKEHLFFAGRNNGLGSKEIVQRCKEVLELVDLAGAASTPLRQFSKGMTQRAALAYALFTDPKILILDEPMSGLDPLGRQLVIDIMHQYHQKGATILFCSHILNDVERICTRIGIMNKGELVKVTTPEELRQDYFDRPVHLTPLEACFFGTINPEK